MAGGLIEQVPPYAIKAPDLILQLPMNSKPNYSSKIIKLEISDLKQK